MTRIMKVCFLAISLCFITIFAMQPTPVTAQVTPIGLVVNGQEVSNITAPVIRQDRMLVPARAVFESLGATVEWHPAERTVYIQSQSQQVVVTIGSSTLSVNGQAVEMPIPAQIIDERTMIPVGAVAANLGFTVEYRDRTVFVDASTVYTVLGYDEETDYDDETEYDIHYNDNGVLDIPEPTLPVTPPAFLPTGPIIPALDLSTASISVENHPATSILSVVTPQGSGSQTFTIVAASPISALNRTLFEDNRLALDIPNSTTVLSGSLPVPPLLSVRGIRASQFNADTTRVVFDLESGTEFSIDITPDRTMIFLTIHQHTLGNFSFEAGEGRDTIILSGVRPSAITAQPRQGRMRFYLSNTQLGTTADTALDGVFATHATLSQSSARIAVLELTINESVSHSITQTGANETTIQLLPSTHSNIRYYFEERAFRIPKTNGFSMNLNHVVRSDLYHQRQFILTLPVNATDHLGFGEILIGDALLRSVTISTFGQNNTQLIFNGNQIFTLDLQENNDYYIIRVMHPRERYRQIVIIDPGHGGRFPGTVRNGIREADLNLAVAQNLIQLIEADGFIRVYTTRNSDMHFSEVIGEDLRIRAEFGNSFGDIFISIHHNSVTGTHVHGVETYYRENALDSARSLTSRNLADIMQRHKLMGLESNDRGVREANFAILRHSTIPSALLELGFMSNPDEFARMMTSEFQWQAAHAIYNGLQESFLWIPAR